ncbi:hypothetical protein C8R45DRAFT_1084245 [Mycena sanguinolenta]|nr:hypothetical protein C8R45DRAFT_1084245 [Mycena sanguinolenta]
MTFLRTGTMLNSMKSSPNQRCILLNACVRAPGTTRSHVGDIFDALCLESLNLIHFSFGLWPEPLTLVGILGIRCPQLNRRVPAPLLTLSQMDPPDCARLPHSLCVSRVCVSSRMPRIALSYTDSTRLFWTFPCHSPRLQKPEHNVKVKRAVSLPPQRNTLINPTIRLLSSTSFIFLINLGCIPRHMSVIILIKNIPTDGELRMNSMR